MGELGQYGGIYVWDFVELLQVFCVFDLVVSILVVYEIIEVLNIEFLDILF